MSRHPRVLRADPGPLAAWIASWELSMRAEALDARTIEMYTDVTVLLAGWLLHTQEIDDWSDVRKSHLRLFFVWLQTPGMPCPHRVNPHTPEVPTCVGYGRSYVNNIGRCLQQWWEWYAAEEEVPNPIKDMRIPSAPKLDDNPPPVIEEDQLRALIKDAESRKDYTSRRDAAVLRLLGASGIRLGELAGIDLPDLDLQKREVRVTGKAGKVRVVKFDARSAIALDRYMRLRQQRLTKMGGQFGASAINALWIGHRRFVRMTEDGLYQAIVRRGKGIGFKIHPHLFRHTFTHRYLDAGGSEGDLMELNGWESPQMLKRYGRSARSARARRGYDRVNVMGDI
jgi:integrase